MKVNCDYCGNEIDKMPGHVNRARKMGMKLFCGRVCFGLDRRSGKSIEQKKEEKRRYDIERVKDPVIWMYRRFQALAYNSSPAGRKMQKRNREKFKQHHLEYCRTPEYRAYKRDYDQVYVAKTKYGEYWESYLTVKEIQKITQPEKYQIRIENGTLNKSQKRKRAWNSLQQTLKKHFGKP